MTGLTRCQFHHVLMCINNALPIIMSGQGNYKVHERHCKGTTQRANAIGRRVDRNLQAVLTDVSSPGHRNKLACCVDRRVHPTTRRRQGGQDNNRYRSFIRRFVLIPERASIKRVRTFATNNAMFNCNLYHAVIVRFAIVTTFTNTTTCRCRNYHAHPPVNQRVTQLNHRTGPIFPGTYRRLPMST